MHVDTGFGARCGSAGVMPADTAAHAPQNPGISPVKRKKRTWLSMYYRGMIILQQHASDRYTQYISH